MSDTLTKAHMVEAVAEANGYTHKKSVEAVEALLELIKSALESGDDVMISAFGKFCVKNKKKRRGSNPVTGKDLILAPKRGHIQTVRETERKTEHKTENKSKEKAR